MTNTPAQELAAGLNVDRVIPFTTATELSDLLTESTAREQTVVPFGGRDSLLTGRPANADVGLDLTSCSGVLAYAPADLTLSVRAGTTWSEIQSTLGEQGQTLPLDIPFPERSTVGGVVATGFAGARRYRQGSLRDLLIGCEYVRGDGLLAKAGGMVVKNVSGFEIPRFLHGSWGALAVLTSVNLKVVPRPRGDGTALISYESMSAAIEAGTELVRLSAPLDAIAVQRDDTGTSLAVRATGRSRAVREILDSVTPPESGSAQRLEDDESAAWWQETTNRFAEDPHHALVAISGRIEHLTTLASELSDTLPDASLLVMPGYGSVRIRVPLTEQRETRAVIERIIAVSGGRDGVCVVESAPVELRTTLDVWGPSDSGRATMQSIKRAFDPGAILNRGRLFV